MKVSTTRTLDANFGEFVKNLSEKPATRPFIPPEPLTAEYAANLPAQLRGLTPQDRIAFAIALMDGDVKLWGFNLAQACALARCRRDEVQAVRRSMYRAAIEQIKKRVLSLVFKLRGTKRSRPTMMAAE